MTTHPTLPYTTASGLRDNHYRGSVGDFLAQNMEAGTRLSVFSAYFTIYAFQGFRSDLPRLVNALYGFVFGTIPDLALVAEDTIG